LVLTLVAGFTGIDDAVPASKVDCAGATLMRASVVGLDLTGAAATITGQRVAVVALLACLIHDTITTTRWG
jgi:hypothetical protein